MKYKLCSANICDSWPPSKDLALEVASPLDHLELSQVWAGQTDQWDTSFKGGMRILLIESGTPWRGTFGNEYCLLPGTL